MMSRPVHAADMRDAVLNDLRGFDIACRTEDAGQGAALCSAIRQLLEQRFAKPVAIAEPGVLPPAPSGLPLPNRVWIVFSASTAGDATRLDATWGSAMRMMGIAQRNSVEPAIVPAAATAEVKARAILHNTPFRAD